MSFSSINFTSISFIFKEGSHFNELFLIIFKELYILKLIRKLNFNLDINLDFQTYPKFYFNNFNKDFHTLKLIWF